jgi:hypothetical protein
VLGLLVEQRLAPYTDSDMAGDGVRFRGRNFVG